MDGQFRDGAVYVIKSLLYQDLVIGLDGHSDNRGAQNMIHTYYFCISQVAPVRIYNRDDGKRNQKVHNNNFSDKLMN